MNFPFYIAKRYLFTSSKNNAINIITRIAASAIVVSAMALFVVLSVFSGLKDFSLSFADALDPDVKVLTSKGKFLTVNPDQEQQIKAIDGIAFYSKTVEERVLFMFNKKEQVTYLKGVDSNYVKVNNMDKKIYIGQWLSPKTNEVVLGYGTHKKLSIALFDFTNSLEVYVPKPGKGAIDNPENAFNKAPLRPIGIYAIGEELDSKYVFTDIPLAQHLLEINPDQVSAIEIRLKPNASEDKVIAALNNIFKDKALVRNRAQLNDSLHKMLNTENVAVYLIFTLVVILTLFNLAGAIIMMILDKKSNLITLFNLGTEIKDLRKIFLYHGLSLSIGGCILGIILGIIVVVLQQNFGLVMVTDNLPYPVVFTVENIIIVAVTIISLGYIASKIASSRVTKRLME